jgi:hypothetical protein
MRSNSDNALYIKDEGGIMHIPGTAESKFEPWKGNLVDPDYHLMVLIFVECPDAKRVMDEFERAGRDGRNGLMSITKLCHMLCFSTEPQQAAASAGAIEQMIGSWNRRMNARQIDYRFACDSTDHNNMTYTMVRLKI